MGIAMIRSGRPNMTLAARIRAAAATASQARDKNERSATPCLIAASPADGRPPRPRDAAPLIGLPASQWGDP